MLRPSDPTSFGSDFSFIGTAAKALGISTIDNPLTSLKDHHALGSELNQVQILTTVALAVIVDQPLACSDSDGLA